MGERKGTNKYYPPDFDPKKHFNLDKYHGTHALRERAKKINQGILVIRFEMPYNIWCEGCGIHIGMGVRYNAEKSKMGNYYTTPIWKFRMKCHLCDQYFEIKTDPAAHDYVIISGARRKEQRWDPKENEQILTEDKNDIKKRAMDAMYNLEHVVEDKAKIKMAIPGISEITEIQQQWKDDYMLNKNARQKFREEKKHLKSEASKDQALLEKSSLGIELVKEHADDVKMAQLMKYRTVESFEEKKQKKRDEIQSRSLFHSAPGDKPSTSKESTITSKKDLKEKQIETTKNKLKQIVSKAKIADQNTFDQSLMNLIKPKNIVDMGIKRKTSITCQNMEVQSKDFDNMYSSPEPTVSTKTESSSGLGSLMLNYDSSSNSDSN